MSGIIAKKRVMSRTSKRLIFSLLMVALPILQFLIFYIYVNFNSILMAFQEYSTNPDGLGYIVTFAGLKNFKDAASVLFSEYGANMIKNSLILYACNLIIVMGLALVFSYYVAKKFMASGFFRVMLYVPHIVSSVVLALLYRYVVTDIYGVLTLKMTGELPIGGLLDGPDTQFITVLIYNIWVGFGTNVMLFTNAMSGINSSVIESAELDGVNIVQEFFYIYIPMIFPTFITFVVTGMAGLFTNQMNMYTFFGTRGSYFDVLGFYLYREAQGAAVAGTNISYSMLAAMGLMITCVIAPITLIVRKLLEKYGPSAD